VTLLPHLVHELAWMVLCLSTAYHRLPLPARPRDKELCGEPLVISNPVLDTATLEAAVTAAELVGASTGIQEFI